jgi:hypothetical protein
VQLQGLDGANSVTVMATTRTGDGDTFLTHWFARVFADEANHTSSFARQATAMWGFMGGNQTIPLTFSICEWEHMTDGKVENLPTGPTTVYFHSSQTAKDLNTCGGPANQNHPGGFGWLNPQGGKCEAYVENGEVGTDVGNNVPNECTAAFFKSLVGETVFMPIFEKVVSQGSKAVYQIEGFAALEISGYRLSGNKEYNHPEDSPPCGGNDRCIRGRFVEYYDLDSLPTSTGTDFGAYVIGLTR